MGQSKTNPTAILAKEGKLPPKPDKKTKRQSERELRRLIAHVTGADTLYKAMGVDKFY